MVCRVAAAKEPREEEQPWMKRAENSKAENSKHPAI
jgi:hypothetical protein